MTERERWTVYPILFLLLGVTFKDKLIPPAIRCRELVVLGETGTPIVKVGENQKSRAGSVVTYNFQGDPQVILFSNHRIGSVFTVDSVAVEKKLLLYAAPQGSPVLPPMEKAVFNERLTRLGIPSAKDSPPPSPAPKKQQTGEKKNSQKPSSSNPEDSPKSEDSPASPKE